MTPNADVSVLPQVLAQSCLHHTMKICLLSNFIEWVLQQNTFLLAPSLQCHPNFSSRPKFPQLSKIPHCCGLRRWTFFQFHCDLQSVLTRLRIIGLATLSLSQQPNSPRVPLCSDLCLQKNFSLKSKADFRVSSPVRNGNTVLLACVRT